MYYQGILAVLYNPDATLVLLRSHRWRYPNDARQGSPGVVTLSQGRVENVLVSAVCSPRVFWVQLLERGGGDDDGDGSSRASATPTARPHEREGTSALERPARLARMEADLTRDAPTLEPMRPALLVPGAFCLVYDTYSKTYALRLQIVYYTKLEVLVHLNRTIAIVQSCNCSVKTFTEGIAESLCSHDQFTQGSRSFQSSHCVFR